jgi:7TM diverse intracellular signalling
LLTLSEKYLLHYQIFTDHPQLRNVLVFFIYLSVTGVVFAQPAHVLRDSSSAQIETYAVLPDHGYTLDKVRTDTTLQFITGDSLRPVNTSYYWLRVIVSNPAHYDEPYNVTLQPSLNNTLYYFDANSQQWVSHRGGIDTPDTGRRNRDIMPFVAKGHAKTVLYLHVDVHLLRQFNQAIKPRITIEKQATTRSDEQFMLITWIVSMLILFLFFLNNLFIYFNFRDKVVLYYLLAQIGGMIYITDCKRFFQVLFPCPIYSIGLLPNGVIHSFSLGNLLQHTGILFIFYGLIQLTRTFLNTATTFPRLNFTLKYGLYTYTLVSVILMVINVFLIYTEDYTIWYHNVLALLLILSVIATCLAGYAERLPAAGPFLVANSLPLTFMLAVTLSHVSFDTGYAGTSVLADLSIVSQALAFSVALVARTKFIQKELNARKIEVQQLGFDIREMELSQKLTELEIQKINVEIGHEKTRNELLQERLEMNQRELASTTLYIVQKNELLAGLKSQLATLNKRYPTVGQQGLKEIDSLLRSDQYLEADWTKFKVHFEQVHPHFFEDLLAKHPSLTKYEIRLYAYFHINLSTKEIAALLNIDPASVRRAKTRLYKKMAIS